jgi:glucokinase
MSDLRLGIDLGGTATRLVLIDAGELRASHIFGTPSDAATALELLTREIGEFLSRAPGADRELSGIGIGASGPIRPDGVIDNPDSLAAFTGQDLVGHLSRSFAVPVRIDNDAVTAALAEVRVGAGSVDLGVLVMTLGTGVGVAVIRNGQPFRGADGQHPEAGHVTIPSGSDRAPACYCGRAVCLEQRGSRSALQRLARSARGTGDLPALQAAALAGDGVAGAVWDAYGTAVGQGLAELCTQHRPELVVLGGSAAAFLPLFRSALVAALATSLSAEQPPVVATGLGEFGGAIGAALLL